MENDRTPPSTTLDGTDVRHRPTTVTENSYRRVDPTAAGDDAVATDSSETGPGATTGSIAARVRASLGSTRARHVLTFASGAPFVGLVAAVEVAIATAALGVPGSTAPLAVGLVAFAVYAADHVADADADAKSTPTRANLARRHGDGLMTAAAVSYGLAVALAVAAGPAALALVLVPGVAWVGYASDWLPAAGRLLAPLGGVSVPRLKDVFLVNSAAVALAWAVAVAVAPLAFAGVAVDPADPAFALVFAYVAARSFVDVEVPNVRDVAADAANGVTTLPVVLGVDGTRRALLAVDALAGGLLAVAGATGLVPAPAVAALGVGLAVSVTVTALADRLGDAALGVAPDCSYLVAGLALAVLSG